MQPLEIEWTFHTPLVPWKATPAHFDGLIAWAQTQRQMRVGDPDLMQGSIRALAEDLPLQKYEADDGRWVWCASFLEVDWFPVGGQFVITRKAEVNEVVRLRMQGAVTSRGAKLDTASGPLRNYLLRYPLRQARSAKAWCIGEKDDVEDLLTEVTTLGGKRVLGLGAVATCTVREVAEQDCHWRRRHMPNMAEGYVQHQGALHPPYWDVKTHEVLWIPADVA